MINKVLIQHVDGRLPTVNHYVAWYGFNEVGLDIEFYEWPALERGDVEVQPEVLVVGGILCVREALRRIGVPAPPPLDYPEVLEPFLGRRVWQETLAEVRRRYQDVGPPLFMKPFKHAKEFNGQLVSRFRDIIASARLPGETRVWVSEPVNFISECRYYVHNNRVVGIGHYRGDPLRVPDPSVAQQAVRVYADTAPVAYGLDMGVTDTGQTLLVEVNDAFALGCYGLAPIKYTRMLEDRWRQLVGLPLL